MRVDRNLNIIAVDANNPRGNGNLLPAGILRESTAELARADCIVITRADDSNPIEELRREIAAQSDGRPTFCSRMELNGMRPVHGKLDQTSIAGEEIRESSIAAFCALGNPESFFSLLRRGGYRLDHTQFFLDHHSYTQSDINRVVKHSIARGAQVLLTTAKDEVKLRSLSFDLPCYAADITIEIENSEKLKALIAEATATRRVA